jgi:hypothetical protein
MGRFKKKERQMSAPSTNVEIQTKRHRGPLYGIAAVCLAVVAAFSFYLGYLAAQGDTPDNAAVKIDGRTGAEVVID